MVARWKGGESGRELAEAYGVTDRTIRNVLARAGVATADRFAAPPSGPRPPALRGVRGAPVELPEDALEAYRDLGGPPADPLRAVAWMHGLLVRSAWRAVSARRTDAEVKVSGELREIARAMAAVTPQTTLHQARKIIVGDAEELERPAGPEMDDAAPLPDRSHRVAPRRGRPRKL